MTSTAIYLQLDGDRWRCVRTPDGRTQQFIGCRHLNPADARRHRAELAARVRDDGSTPIPSAPQPGSGSLEPSSEPRSGSRSMVAADPVIPPST
jgi:hypothetical protein